MQTVTIKKPIPIWILAFAALVITALVLAILSMAGIVDLTFIVDGVTYAFTAPLAWASGSLVTAVVFIAGFTAIVGVVFLMIAKRRYLVGQKVLVAGASTYVPRGTDLTSTPVAPAVQEEVKKE